MKREHYRPLRKAKRTISCTSTRGGDGGVAAGEVVDADRATVVQLPDDEQLAGVCSVERTNGSGGVARIYKMQHSGGAAIYPGGIAATIYADSAPAQQ